MNNLIETLRREFLRRSAVAHISVVLLTLQAFIATVYRIGINQSFADIAGELAFGTYVTDGRLIVFLSLWLIGLIAYILLSRLTPWILAIQLVWVNFVDEIIYRSIGGPDIWNQASQVLGYFGQLATWRDTLLTVSLISIVFASIWHLTKQYRARVSRWIDNRGIEVAKNSADYEHTSTLAIIALVLAFIFPIGGLILAAIAKRDIALGKQKMGGLDLIVAANIVSIAILLLQALVAIVWLGNLAQLWQLLSELS